jgi:hypothetical protein
MELASPTTRYVLSLINYSTVTLIIILTTFHTTFTPSKNKMNHCADARQYRRQPSPQMANFITTVATSSHRYHRASTNTPDGAAMTRQLSLRSYIISNAESSRITYRGQYGNHIWRNLKLSFHFIISALAVSSKTEVIAGFIGTA